jgi:hypothetical protein
VVLEVPTSLQQETPTGGLNIGDDAHVQTPTTPVEPGTDPTLRPPAGSDIGGPEDPGILPDQPADTGVSVLTAESGDMGMMDPLEAYSGAVEFTEIHDELDAESAEMKDDLLQASTMHFELDRIVSLPPEMFSAPAATLRGFDFAAGSAAEAFAPESFVTAAGAAVGARVPLGLAEPTEAANEATWGRTDASPSPVRDESYAFRSGRVIEVEGRPNEVYASEQAENTGFVDTEPVGIRTGETIGGFLAGLWGALRGLGGSQRREEEERTGNSRVNPKR